MDRVAGIILRYRFVFLALIVILTGFFARFAIEAETDNSIEVWLKQDDPNLEYYNRFIDRYGDEEFLIIANDGNDHFTAERMKQINSISERLEHVHGVRNVISMASVFKDKLSAPYFKEELKKNKTEPVLEVFKKAVLDDPLYVGNVVSGNGQTTAIIATVSKGSSDSRIQLLNETRKIIRTAEEGHDLQSPVAKWEKGEQNTTPENFYLAGPSIVNAELDRMSQKDMSRFIPAMFAVALVILTALFRNITGVLIPAITICINIIWSVGLFVIFDNSMNMISEMLLPLIFIVSLATTVHILNRFYQEAELLGDNRKSIQEAIKHICVPCFLTCLTTSIGFLSLTVSKVTPVKTTGIFMAAGIMMSFFVCITFVPGILSLFPGGKSISFVKNQKNKNLNYSEFRGIYGFIGRVVKNNTVCVLILSVIFIGASIYGITKIRAESNVFESFPEDSEISKSTSHIEQNLMGLFPMEIVINAVNAGGVFNPEVLAWIEKLQSHLKSIPEITKSVSVAGYVKNLNYQINKDNADNNVITKEKAIDYVKLAALHGDKLVKNLYTEDGNEGRVVVRMKNVGSSRYQEIAGGIKRFAKKGLAIGVGCTITGIVPLLMDMQGYLIESQIKTFALAFILIFICIALLLKSAKTGIMSMIPNIIPIVIALGVMGYLSINLDVATIMIASVAIGISVDDTIHFLYRFKKEFKKERDHYLAIQRTISGVGKALIFTTVVATCGFLVFCLSNFKPIQYFGLLTGITMVTALLADLFILPACILLFKPKF